MAGVALGDMDLPFVWQAWHLRHWAGCGDAVARRWGPVTPRLFCMAGVALGDVCLRFVWQAWHLRHWAGSGDGLGRRCGPVTPRLFCVAGVALGRLPSFCVAGVARTALGWLWWRPWSALGPCDAAPVLRGRRGTWRRLPSFCVAGVALGDMDLPFVWQVWHLRHCAGCGDLVGAGAL
eukprot:s968_g48.t1